ncbi:MAG: RNA polymerase sporulation sigma factor SigK [Clostridiales bacterium]|nr:RNA polymerase sporulation sigma factor SigK [Clostridiales bacterium]MBQ3107126.1 RNA polymerase sporulation sigma factor SigK [Bacillota bacterium]
MSLSLLLASLFISHPLILLSGYVTSGGSFPKPLTDEEEQAFLARWAKGDREARSILIERNLRLAAHIAKKYNAPGRDPDDLVSIGTIGLIKAIDTYNGRKSVRLATYAARCIENEILMHLRVTKKNRGEVSLSEPIGTDRDGNEISFNDILSSDDESILDALDTRMQIQKLYRAVEQLLDPREKLVICKRYGLGNRQRMPQREVARELGISRSYISRIEKKALEKLRSAFSDEEADPAKKY